MTRTSSAYCLTAQHVAASETLCIGVVPDLKRSHLRNDLKGTSALQKKLERGNIKSMTYLSIIRQSAEDPKRNGQVHEVNSQPTEFARQPGGGRRTFANHPTGQQNTPARPKIHPKPTFTATGLP